MRAQPWTSSLTAAASPTGAHPPPLPPSVPALDPAGKEPIPLPPPRYASPRLQ